MNEGRVLSYFLTLFCSTSIENEYKAINTFKKHPLIIENRGITTQQDHMTKTRKA